MSPLLLSGLIAAAGCAALGQILLKMGATDRGDLASLVNPYVVGGFVFYGLGSVLWLLALTRLPLTVVYPFTMLTLALVLISSIALLGERPTVTTLAGWAIIAAGLCVVALGAAERA